MLRLVTALRGGQGRFNGWRDEDKGELDDEVGL